jgi:hypothetical protein
MIGNVSKAHRREDWLDNAASYGRKFYKFKAVKAHWVGWLPVHYVFLLLNLVGITTIICCNTN